MLAREHGYSPKGSHAEWANAWVSETIADFGNKGHTKHMFAPEVSEEVVKAWAADMVTFNGHFERHLAKNGWKYLAGDNLTASDFHLYSNYHSIALNKTKKHANVTDALAATLNTDATPHLNKWLGQMDHELKHHMETRPAAWI